MSASGFLSMNSLRATVPESRVELSSRLPPLGHTESIIALITSDALAPLLFRSDNVLLRAKFASSRIDRSVLTKLAATLADVRIRFDRLREPPIPVFE